MNKFEKKFFSINEMWKSLFSMHKNESRFSNRSNLIPNYYEFQSYAKQYFKIIKHSIIEGSFNLKAAAENDYYENEKKRKLYKFSIENKFIIYHLARILYEFSEKDLPDSLFSFRKNYSSIGAINNLSEYIKRTNSDKLYIAKYDIEKFGESMDHQLLEKIFLKYSNSKLLNENIFKKICKFNFEREGQTISNIRGLPTGSYLQIVFENLYLLEIDRQFENSNEVKYLRYGDDIILASEDISAFERKKETIVNLITQKKLLVNRNKSKEIILKKPHQLNLANEKSYFEYLGLRFNYKGEISLPRRKLRKILNFIKYKLINVSKRNNQNKSVEEKIKLLIHSFNLLIENGNLFKDNPILNYAIYFQNEKELKEIDRWVAVLVLSLVRGKGFKKGYFENKNYKKLRELGLVSLLHCNRTNSFVNKTINELR